MKLELSSPRKTDDTWHEVTLGEVAHLNEETYSPKPESTEGVGNKEVLKG